MVPSDGAKYSWHGAQGKLKCKALSEIIRLVKGNARVSDRLSRRLD